MARSTAGALRHPLDFDEFRDALARELDLPAMAITGNDDTRLVDDLAFDSLLTFEMLLVVEVWAGVMLPDALVGQLITLGDVYDVYRKRVTPR
jgi:acyl carrier protein